jgi:hypothetical protein
LFTCPFAPISGITRATTTAEAPGDYAPAERGLEPVSADLHARLWRIPLAAPCLKGKINAEAGVAGANQDRDSGRGLEFETSYAPHIFGPTLTPGKKVSSRANELI